MAERVLPQHKPHPQLRTEAPAQRPHTDKYVSAFVTGDNIAELTFKNPILNQSADHFKVGIDDLTVNFGNLSMLDFSDPTQVLMRIKRRGVTAHPNTDADEWSDAAPTRDFLMPDFVLPQSQAEIDLAADQAAFGAAAAGSGEHARLGHKIESYKAAGSQRALFRDGFEFRVDRVYVSLVEIMERFNQIATAVNGYAEQYGLSNNDPNSPGYVLWNHFHNDEYYPADHRVDMLKFSLSSNGQLQILGNRVFWANFVIEVPIEKYRQILFRNSDQLATTLHPGSGNRDPSYLSQVEVTTIALQEARAALALLPNDAQLQNAIAPAVAAVANADATVFRAIPIVDWVTRDFADFETRTLQYNGSGNLFSTLDRRVTLEVGCSLPVKNSPLIDHGVEAPDYVLGRYMFHKPYTVSAQNSNYTQESLGVQTIQGSRDRVVFHHLRPQQKIQTLRLRLWVRVRKYNESTKRWTMETILCPVGAQDYWHIRLQFVSK